MTFRKTPIAILVATALSAPFGSANADVIASAVIKFTDFKIFGSTDNGTTFSQLDASDFRLLNFTSTADADATLLGTSESIVDAEDDGANGIDFPFTFPPATVATPAGNNLCVGDCNGNLVGPTNNDNAFQKITLTDVQTDGTTSYAWSDQLETGAPISGLTDDSGNPVANDADIANSSYNYLDDTSVGSAGANSDNGLNADFQFQLLNAQDFLEVEFTVDAFAYVETTSDEVNPFASASTLYTLNINEGVQWNPVLGGVVFPGLTLGSLTDALAVSTQSAGDSDTATTGPATLRFRTTGGLDTATEYTLTARLESSVETSRVPEPGSLALLGMGLLGFAAAHRRKRKV